MTTGLDYLRAYAGSDENRERLAALGLEGYDDGAYAAAVEADGPDSDRASTLHPICYVEEATGEAILGGAADALWREHLDGSHVGDVYVTGCPTCEGWFA